MSDRKLTQQEADAIRAYWEAVRQTYRDEDGEELHPIALGRLCRDNGLPMLRDLARSSGISEAAVTRIVHGRSYRPVDSTRRV